MKSFEIADSVIEYANTVLAGKAKDWRTKFAIGFGAASYRNKLIETIESMGFKSENDSINMQNLKNAVIAGFKAAAKVELFGGVVVLDKEDAEDLFRFLGV